MTLRDESRTRDEMPLRTEGTSAPVDRPAAGATQAAVVHVAATPALVETAQPAARPRRGKRLVVLTLLAAAIGFGGYKGHEWWTIGLSLIHI